MSTQLFAGNLAGHVGDYGVQPDGSDHDWREEAACAGMATSDSDPFYDARHPQQYADLAAICADCPVFDLCKKDAEAFEAGAAPGEIWGFRAGRTAEERRAAARAAAGEAPRVVAPSVPDDVWRQHFNAGATVAEVAEALGTTEWFVSQARKRLGFRGGQGKSAPREGDVPDSVKDRAYRALFAGGASLRQVAGQMGVSHETAARIKRRLIEGGDEFPELRGGGRGRPQIERTT